jgi:ketosteroid isomerase-like protein
MSENKPWTAVVSAFLIVAFLAYAGWRANGVAQVQAAEGPTQNWSAAQLNAMGAKAIDAWLSALVKHDPAAVAAVLAPEFQIMRSDGSAYGKDDYVAEGLPNIAKQPEVEKLVVTGFGDMLVARYWLRVEETANGKVAEAHAPRITVFRRSADMWLVVAHGNFAQFQ